MNSVHQFLADLVREHGLTLLVGTTALLAMFSLLVRYSRSLSTKNLLASTAMVAVLGYLVVAVVPLPRFGPNISSSQQSLSQERPPASIERTPITPGEQMFAALQHPVIDEPAAGNSAVPTMPSRTERMGTLQPPGSPVAPGSVAPVNGFDLSTWLAGALAIGGLLFAAHLLLGWLQLRRLLAKSHNAPAELAELVELPTRTSLRIVKAHVQPFCCGLLRPTIVLPQKLAQPSDETRFILLHERAHLTSGDTRARLLAALLRPLLFWHPLYWWLQRQLRFTSELLADDAAAQGSVADYVRCMMTLSTHPDPATGGALVATIFRRRSELFRRLEMMLQRDEAISRCHSPLSRWTRAASTLVLIALCAGTFGVERAVAQSPRTEQVQTQVRALKAELDRLRREIVALRDAEQAKPEPEPAPPSSRSPKTFYRVQKGDTLARIAKKILGSSRRTDEILRSNPKVHANRLRVGQLLAIPLRSTGSGTAPVADSSRSQPETRTRSSLMAGRVRGEPAPLPGASSAPLPSRRSDFGTRLPTARSPRAHDARLPEPVAAAPQGPATPGPARVQVPVPGAPAASGFGGFPSTPSAPRASRNGHGPRTAPGPTASGPGISSPRRKAPSAPSYPSPGRRTAGTTASQPTTSPNSTAPGGVASAPRMANTNGPATSLSSLADLVTRCIELRGDVEIQEVNVRHAGSEQEAEIAKIRLRTKKSQFKAIESMLSQELRAAEVAHAYAKKLHERGFATAAEVQATESKIVLLSRALR